MAQSRRAYLAGALLMVVATLVVLVAGRTAHASTTFHVNSTADLNDQDFPGGTFDGSSDGKCDADAANGELCTLRAAIQEANVTAGVDIIDFKIGGTGIKTITPTAANGQLPAITDTTTINGYTQGNAHPNTLAVGNDAVLNIELKGSPTVNANGLKIKSDNNVVRGLVINNFNTDGISIEGDDNKIEGNFIGTDPTGTLDQGNDDFGVQIEIGVRNIVGGTTPDKRNLISGNDFIGVFLSVGTAGSKVLGNYIGTKRGGKRALGNFLNGVSIQGTTKNFIGDGTAAGANKIAFNGGDGVGINDFSNPNDANLNRILRNSIFANADLGIDLGNDGPTPNDGDNPSTPQIDPDSDSGPNTLQNFPVISSAKTTGTTITIKGKLNSTPNKTFIIRFFSNLASEPAGNEGRRFLGSKSVTTGPNGNVSFTRQLALRVPARQRITATATDLFGNTSEFSAPRTVVRQ